jgi:hypothetical protein
MKLEEFVDNFFGGNYVWGNRASRNR